MSRSRTGRALAGLTFFVGVAALAVVGPTPAPAAGHAAAAGPVLALADSAATVPDAPVALTARPGDGQVTVSWLAPADNGSPITGYIVTASANAGSTVDASASTAGATSVTLTGLVNGTGYGVRVSAVNAIGTGPVSYVWVQSVCGAPGVPGTPTATPGDRSATVTWSQPGALGCSLNYTVVVIPGGARVASYGNPTVTVAGLNNGTAYTFSVLAENAAGASPPSQESAPVTPWRGAPVDDAWQRSGGLSGPLGSPVGALACDPPTGGCSRPYTGGDIYWSPDTGAQIVRGAILERYRATGGADGGLGFPVSSDTRLDDGGYVVDFQRGSIYWSQATGAHDVRGDILARYRWTGGPGYLGYPTSNDSWDLNARNVAYTNFQSGDIVWTADTGAQVVRGAILTRWLQTGASAGPLGVPTSSDTQLEDGGFVVDFMGGSILWSAATGAHDVRGAILDTYAGGGGPAYLGYPTGNDSWDRNAPGVAYTNFESGDIVWTAGTGAQVVRGDILKRWLQTGASAGGLGVPISSDAQLSPSMGYVVYFQRGAIYWHWTTGAHDVRGAILARYEAMGGPDVMGYPKGDDSPDTRVPGVWYSNFTGGDIVWSAGTGAQAVRGAILQRWLSVGASAGALGLPVTSDAPAPGGQGWLVDFQHGSVYWKNGGGPRGADVVPDPINAAYRSAGGTTSWLGYPTQNATARAGYFEHGSIVVDRNGWLQYKPG